SVTGKCRMFSLDTIDLIKKRVFSKNSAVNSLIWCYAKLSLHFISSLFYYVAILVRYRWLVLKSKYLPVDRKGQTYLCFFCLQRFVLLHWLTVCWFELKN